VSKAVNCKFLLKLDKLITSNILNYCNSKATCT